MNRTQVQIPEYFARRTERKLERETENMADVLTNFCLRTNIVFLTSRLEYKDDHKYTLER